MHENINIFLKGIVSDSNNKIVWHEPEDINKKKKKCYIQNFSWFRFMFTTYAWLCALTLLHRLLC